MDDERMADFLAQLPALPAFTAVFMCGKLLRRCVFEIVRVFPNLVNLTLDGGTSLKDEDASLLLGLHSLHTLSVNSSWHLTYVGAATLLLLPCLKRLLVSNCPKLKDSEILQMQAPAGLVVDLVTGFR